MLSDIRTKGTVTLGNTDRLTDRKVKKVVVTQRRWILVITNCIVTLTCVILVTGNVGSV